MNVLKFDHKEAKLCFGKSEINIFIKALENIFYFIEKRDFEARITISQAEVLLLKNRLSKSLATDNTTIKLLLTYQNILALNNSLNEVYYRMHSVNFEKDMRCQVQEFRKLKDSIFSLTRKMTPDTAQGRIIERGSQMKKTINPYKINLPRTIQVKKECILSIGEYKVAFLLFSIQNTKIFSGAKIIILNRSNKSKIKKTRACQIRVSTLIDIISYFEEYIHSKKQDSNLFDSYTLYASDSEKLELFQIKLLPNSSNTEQNIFLDVVLRVNCEKEQAATNYFEINAPVSFCKIDNFTSTIKEYLIETVNIEEV